MGSYQGVTWRTPWGPTEYLRSTQDVKTTTHTVAASTIPVIAVDGEDTKALPKGCVLAEITSGGESGKVGPYDDGATDGREVAANIVGINNTELPWQFQHRDVDVAVVYEAAVVEANVTKVDLGAYVALDTTARDAMDVSTKTRFTFH